MLAFNAVGMDAVAMSGASSSSGVSADLAVAYSVGGAISSDLAVSYALRAAASSDLAALYAVRAQVSTDLGAAFTVNGRVGSDLAGAYAVRDRVSAELVAAYSVQALVMASVSASLSAAYAVCASVSRDLVCAFAVEAPEEYVRAPLGAPCSRGLPAYPETVRRIGLAESAISLDAARRAARVDGDELDDDILTAAVAYTEAAEHLTGRAFVQGPWKAGYRAFAAEMILPKPPLVSVTRVTFYDPSGVQRTLDPQDYFVDVDAEPAVLTPAPGRTWPAALDRANTIEVQYAAGYGLTEASVPKAVKQYVSARVQQQFSPVSTAKDANFDRLLDGLTVYL
jgi:uncharacterized phiE125 gp8 family phage protein